MHKSQPLLHQLLALAARVGVIAIAAFCALSLRPSAGTPTVVQAGTEPVTGCHDGIQPSGAIYRICMPADWNGRLVLWAHGFVAPQEPVGIPEDQLVLPDGTSLPDTITGLGYAFATSSYRKNGLAILEGIEDLKEVATIFTAQQGEPKRTFVTGASEGGLVTALSVERNPTLYDGGIAACGPVGDFPDQINYFGDARVLFDYFFPGMIPGNASDIPQEVIDHWETKYAPSIRQAILENGDKREELMRTARIPRQNRGAPLDSDTIVQLLWYNIKATNEAKVELKGQPFDNRNRNYAGSSDDRRLNANVQRYRADAAAVLEMQMYQTKGNLRDPLVTLHTTGDPVVLYWHETQYNQKAPGFLHVNIPVLRGGHCNFTINEALSAFLVLRVLRP